MYQLLSLRAHQDCLHCFSDHASCIIYCSVHCLRKDELWLFKSHLGNLITILREEATSAFTGSNAGRLSWSHWNLEMLDVEEWKPEYPKKPPEARQKPTKKLNRHVVPSRSRTHATIVGGDRSHHHAIPAPQIIIKWLVSPQLLRFIDVHLSKLDEKNGVSVHAQVLKVIEINVSELYQQTLMHNSENTLNISLWINGILSYGRIKFIEKQTKIALATRISLFCTSCIWARDVREQNQSERSPTPSDTSGFLFCFRDTHQGVIKSSSLDGFWGSPFVVACGGLIAKVKT